MEKLKGERNVCGKSLVNMQRTLAENARHVDQVCAQGVPCRLFRALGLLSAAQPC